MLLQNFVNVRVVAGGKVNKEKDICPDGSRRMDVVAQGIAKENLVLHLDVGMFAPRVEQAVNEYGIRGGDEVNKLRLAPAPFM